MCVLNYCQVIQMNWRAQETDLYRFLATVKTEQINVSCILQVQKMELREASSLHFA